MSSRKLVRISFELFQLSLKTLRSADRAENKATAATLPFDRNNAQRSSRRHFHFCLRQFSRHCVIPSLGVRIGTKAKTDRNLDEDGPLKRFV